MAFEMLPEAFYGIEVGAVWRQEFDFDVMPVEGFRFVPTRVVQNEDDFFAVAGTSLAMVSKKA